LKRRQERLRRATRSDQADAPRLDAGHDRLVRVVAQNATVAKEQRVDRLALRLVAELDHRLLVRDRDVGPGVTGGHEPGDGFTQLLRPDLQWHVGPIQSASGEGGVLHARRERPGDRLTEQRDEPRGAADHG